MANQKNYKWTNIEINQIRKGIDILEDGETILIFKNTDLAGRSIASIYRKLLFDLLSQSPSVTFDMRNVLSMADGFVDELFAVTALEIGIDEFLSRVNFVFFDEIKNQRVQQIANSIYVRKNGSPCIKANLEETP